ncbi:MAG: hypothetical protein AAF701_07575, partial [Pseudomonadota bacterium]
MDDYKPDFKTRLHIWAYNKAPVLGLPYRIWDEIYLARHQAKMRTRRTTREALNANRLWIFTIAPDTTAFAYMVQYECDHCGYYSGVYWDKYATLIDEIRRNHPVWCSACGAPAPDQIYSSTLPAIIAQKSPAIDADVLHLWLQDEDYYFCEQEEDYILEHVDPLAIMAAIDRGGGDEYKIAVLASFASLNATKYGPDIQA